MNRTMMSVLILCLLVAGVTLGCDNRSQMEKDADKAMQKLDKALE